MVTVTKNEPVPPEPTFGISGLSQREFQVIVESLDFAGCTMAFIGVEGLNAPVPKEARDLARVLRGQVRA